MSTALYWFRNDLRLGDNLALLQACAHADALLPVYCHAPPQAPTPWGFERVGPHRQRVLRDTLDDLARQLHQRGSRLLEVQGPTASSLTELAHRVGATTIWCEAIAAPQEQAEVQALRDAGWRVHSLWQSSLLAPQDLPFDVAQMPEVFTAFRHAVERAKVQPQAPHPAPEVLPPLPADAFDAPTFPSAAPPSEPGQAGADPRSSFPYGTPACQGGETAALAHLQRYFDSGLVHRYKATRNGLSGLDYSSKLSPWLASGALSPRVAFAALQQCEASQGASDGSYWLWFELLWRDHFRLLHLQHGKRLYRERGLAAASPGQRHNPQGFARWCHGDTGQPLVDAGMRELAATGCLSNRLRQVVASYLIHDLACDWRAGAAWFESQLVDFDVHSNQGNWLYISGRGTDPRGGRRFNPDKQTQDHDPHGQYRAMWGTA